MEKVDHVESNVMLGGHWGAICLLNPFGWKDCSILDLDLGDITFFSLYGLFYGPYNLVTFFRIIELMI